MVEVVWKNRMVTPECLIHQAVHQVAESQVADSLWPNRVQKRSLSAPSAFEFLRHGPEQHEDEPVG